MYHVVSDFANQPFDVIPLAAVGHKTRELLMGLRYLWQNVDVDHWFKRLRTRHAAKQHFFVNKKMLLEMNLTCLQTRTRRQHSIR